jgi:UPF0755 protein
MRAFKIFLSGLIGLVIVLGGGGYWWGKSVYQNKVITQAAPEVMITVEKGQGFSATMTALRNAGVDMPEPLTSISARLRGDSNQIKAGTYQFKAPLTVRSILDKLVSGDVMLSEIRFPEGWTFRQMREVVDKHPLLKHETAKLSDAELLKKLGAVENHPEGLFFPSTYRFSPNALDMEVYKNAYRQTKKLVDEAWAKRPPDSPLKSPYDLLTLASIVEKETGTEADRPKVAAVFLNRMKIGMPLQSDPTTIYGMGDKFDGNLRRKDLQTDTPYNTYTRGGLTPTPISLVSKASLQAVIAPASIKALYFVARGDGSSEFSDDLSAHNRAVQKYQLKK